MDTGKIKTFTPSVNLRADAGPEQQSARRSNAGDIAAKLAPAFLLHAAAQAAEESANVELTGEGPPSPRTGVVVNLSTPLPLIAAGQALQAARTLVDASDYNHLDPRKAVMRPHAPAGLHVGSPPAPAAAADAAETLGAAASVALAAQTAERAIASPSASTLATPPELRPDLNPHAHPGVVLHQNTITAVEHRNAASAVSQARDTERLAGLTIPPEARAAAAPHLGKLIAGAIVLAVVVFVLL